MNRREWLECDIPELKWYWRTKCEEIRKTLKYNSDPNATHKHHLFITPEQIEYNNAHYELWGFNEDGTFLYTSFFFFPVLSASVSALSEISRVLSILSLLL